MSTQNGKPETTRDTSMKAVAEDLFTMIQDEWQVLAHSSVSLDQQMRLAKAGNALARANGEDTKYVATRWIYDGEDDWMGLQGGTGRRGPLIESGGPLKEHGDVIDVAIYDPETEEELYRENGLHRDYASDSIDEVLEENGWTEL